MGKGRATKKGKGRNHRVLKIIRTKNARRPSRTGKKRRTSS